MAGTNPALIVRIAANLAELKANLADGTSTINTTTAAMAKLATSFQGDKLIQHAQNVVAAVHEIGGASKLTEAEQARVNATVAKAIEKYALLGKDAPQAMRDLEAATRQTQSATELFQEKWAAFAVAAGAAWIGVQKVVGEVQGWIKASSEQEDATVRLTAALQAQGTFTPELLRQYLALSDSLQKTTVNADELTLEMQALLVQVGHVMPDQMASALKAAMDLAAGLRMDLPAATLLLAKSLGTGGDSLGRLKGLLGDTAIAGQGTEAVLAAINAKFGGQAQAQVETYSGKIAVLNNQYGEMKEKAGDLLAGALLPLFNLFGKLPESVQTVVAAGVLLIGVLAPLGIAVGGISSAVTLLLPVLTVAWPGAFAAMTGALATVTPYLGPAGIIAAGIVAWFQVFKNLDVFVWAAKAGWEALSGTFTSAATAITHAARATYEGVKGWLVDRFNDVVESIRFKVDTVTGFFRGMYEAVVGHSIVPEMVTAIAAEMARLPDVMVRPAEAAAAGVVAAMKTAQVAAGTISFNNPLGTATAANTDPTIWRWMLQGYTLNEAMALAGGFGEHILGKAGAAKKAAEHKAMGGPVSAQTPYVVGERGPELFIPGSSGSIVAAGSGGTTINLGGIYITQPLGTPDAIGEAITARMRSLGMRL